MRTPMTWEAFSALDPRRRAGPKVAYDGAGGLAWYWIVDLDASVVTGFEGRGGVLVEVQRIVAPELVVGPFPVLVDPAALVA